MQPQTPGMTTVWQYALTKKYLTEADEGSSDEAEVPSTVISYAS